MGEERGIKIKQFTLSDLKEIILFPLSLLLYGSVVIMLCIYIKIKGDK
jgi:hypothetical protein